MVGRSKIVEISRNVPSAGMSDSAEYAGQEMIAAIKRDENSAVLVAEQDVTEFEHAAAEPEWLAGEAEHPQRRWAPVIMGAVLITLLLAWTGFWGWANQSELLRAQNPARLVELIGLWAVPVSLLAMCWLLAMRMSTTEARRFGDVAALLRSESEALEVRIKTVNGEIALARSFLAENARELESVGRASAAKLTEAAEQLVIALSDSDHKAQVLESVSSAAVSNVELLRNHLPVVTSAAKDATNQIGNAGNIANEQIQSLTASLRSMDEAMAASSATMNKLERQTVDTSQNIHQAADSASATLQDSLTKAQQMTHAILSKLQEETASAEHRIGEASENIAALSDSNAQQLADQLSKLDNAVGKIGTATQSQHAALQSIMSQVDASLDGSSHKLAHLNDEAQTRFEALTAKVSASILDCDKQLGAIDASATDRIAHLAFAINALAESSSELGVNLAANEQRASTVMSDAEKLLSTLGHVSQELSDQLPDAVARLQSQLTENLSTIETLRAEGVVLAEQAAGLNEAFGAVDQLLSEQKLSVDTLLSTSSSALAERKSDVVGLLESLQSTQIMIDQVSSTAEQQLNGSLARVAEAAQAAALQSKAIVETEFAHIGERLTEQNRTLLAGAIDSQMVEMGAAVKDAIDRNIRLSEEATHRVAAQLQSITELTSNLELRAAAAKDQFDGIDDEAFARRIALLTESLNSASIDVAKILSNEVTDTAWAAYLKGDRGVFTRRAVRLLDSGEARIIAGHYDDDAEFRDHVNRYIHDFEAMMRVLLSTRDGNAIGVTLLSSDVGKLYVALAQAIDRLRN